jgi:hypothetical protein
MPNLPKKIPNGLKPKDLIGIPWRVAFALQADGWYLRSDVIWAKKNGLPESVADRPTKAHEYLFLLAKSEKYWCDMDAIREKNSPTGMPYGSSKTKNGITVREAQGEKLGSSSALRPMTFEQRQHYATNGRNKRTVWSLSSVPFPGAHFAVMPEALVEPCLLAGCPARVCAECGEPWVRVVEREPYQQRGDHRRHAGYSGHGSPTGKTPGSNTRGMPYRAVLKEGHAPTCQCSVPHCPGIALDPFFGVGTVGVVAKKFKRDWLGVELNSDYVEMAQERLDQTQPALFAR